MAEMFGKYFPLLITILICLCVFSSPVSAQLKPLPSGYVEKQFQQANTSYKQYPKSTPKPSIKPSSTPIIAHNATDAELLQLINQVHKKQLSNTDMLLLNIAMSILGSDAQKLARYHFLASLPLPEISQNLMLVIITFKPLLLVGLLFGLFLFIRWLFRSFMPFILSVCVKQSYEQKTLQLIFPADTTKSAYATEQLYSLLHTLSRQLTFKDSVLHKKNMFSLEIISSKKEGIRYLLTSAPQFTDIIKRNIMSYLPGIKVVEIESNLDSYLQGNTHLSIMDLALSAHFALPLDTQKTLSENDPISYLTGNMTKLKSDELLCFQVVVTPLLKHIHHNEIDEMSVIKGKIYMGKPLTNTVMKSPLDKFLSLPMIALLWFMVKITAKLSFALFAFVLEMITLTVDSKSQAFASTSPSQPRPQGILNPYEVELATLIKNKISQPLFEASVRVLMISPDKHETSMRLNGILASFGQLSSPYQSIVMRSSIFTTTKRMIQSFLKRELLKNVFTNNPILSTSELTDIFHFPYSITTKTEDLVKVYSPELPTPLSLKNNTHFDVVFGENTYNGDVIPVGLTDDDRSRHVYMIGQTGSGKSTVIYHMAKGDIERGRGLAVIDPHGDLVEQLLETIPEDRLNEVIYFNPYDVKHPIGINLLELSPCKDEDELELEKELVCESVISLFRRIFMQEEQSSAHRIEYILRNTIYTAFSVKDATIFTVYDLLNDPDYAKSVIKDLTDENLRNFWKNEFGKAGNFQMVKMISGITAKVGRFLFSPTAKRIFEQPKSTINFDSVLSQQQILLCNLSEGKISEDVSQVLGTVMITKIHQAAVRRSRITSHQRTPFYLFVDEFQNYATSSFTKLLSGGRKFGLRVTVAEQSTSQQSDHNITNVILSNSGTVLCFRTANPIDEELMLKQFAPDVTKGDLSNLPRFHFYMKLAAVTPEAPFSGTTLPIISNEDSGIREHVIESSRKNYSIVYQKPPVKIIKKSVKKKTKKVSSNHASRDISTL